MGTARDRSWDGILSTIHRDGVLDVRRVQRNILFRILKQERPEFFSPDVEEKVPKSLLEAYKPHNEYPPNLDSDPVSMVVFPAEMKLGDRGLYEITQEEVYETIEEEYEVFVDEVGNIHGEDSVRNTLKDVADFNFIKRLPTGDRSRWIPDTRSESRIEISKQGKKGIIKGVFLSEFLLDGSTDRVGAIAAIEEREDEILNTPNINSGSLLEEYKEELIDEEARKVRTESRGEVVKKHRRMKERRSVDPKSKRNSVQLKEAARRLVLKRVGDRRV